MKQIVHEFIKLRNKLFKAQSNFNIGKLLLTSLINPLSLSKVLTY